MIKKARWLLSARISRFALVGASGAIGNLLIMMAFINLGINYVPAALVAGEITILSNFILQETLAFTDRSEPRRPLSQRFFRSYTFNTVEALARTPLLWVMVEFVHMASPLAQAGTLLAAFFVRYAYHVNVVYAPLKPPAQLGNECPKTELQPLPEV